jgi:hypothetical protein
MLRLRRGRAALAVVVALAVAFAVNTIAVDAVTRAATARSGGRVMETGVVPANVTTGLARRSIGGTRSRLDSPPVTASI